jgi:hypothetical protein
MRQKSAYAAIWRLMGLQVRTADYSYYKNCERFLSTMQAYLALAWLLRLEKYYITSAENLK